MIKERNDQSVQDPSDGFRIIRLLQVKQDSQQVEADRNHKDVLEVLQVTIVAHVEQQILILGEITTVVFLLVQFRLDKVYVEVDQEHGRREVVADVPAELCRHSPCP